MLKQVVGVTVSVFGAMFFIACGGEASEEAGEESSAIVGKQAPAECPAVATCENEDGNGNYKLYKNAGIVKCRQIGGVLNGVSCSSSGLGLVPPQTSRANFPSGSTNCTFDPTWNQGGGGGGQS